MSLPHQSGIGCAGIKHVAQRLWLRAALGEVQHICAVFWITASSLADSGSQLIPRDVVDSLVLRGEILQSSDDHCWLQIILNGEQAQATMLLDRWNTEDTVLTGSLKDLLIFFLMSASSLEAHVLLRAG